MYSSSSTQGDQTSGTFNGAKIYFCHTSRSALSTTFADNYSGNTPTLMLSRSALSMNWTMGQWNEIPLDETFAYNGTDNLLIEIQWTSSGSSLLAGATSPASQNALLGTYGASSGSTYYRSVFQLHYTTPVEPIVWHTDYQVDSGDGIVDPGETIAVSSWLRSVGTTANSLQATLSSTSGWCSVTQPNWSAGTMNMGATANNSGSPFQIAVNADEIGAWTDPADGNSLLCIEGSAVSVNTNMVIGWRSVPGQLYNVYSCIDPAGSWSNQTVSPCVGSATGFNQCTVTVDRAESFRFFKIGTE